MEPLHFHYNWTVPAEAVTPEAFATTYREFSLTYDAQKQLYRVAKGVDGRVIITNYDPAVLSNEERFRLNEEAEEAPFNLEKGYEWNRKAFSLLYQLFQMSVSTAAQPGPAITISK